MSKKDQSHTEFLCIDIEASCWPNGQIPTGMLSEIIEIGYSIFDATNNLIKPHGSILVKPQHSTISEFCVNLTHITREMVNRGVLFAEACEILKKNLNSQGCPWASFGAYDRIMFQDQCKRLNIEYPFTKQHLNVKQLAAALTGKTRGLGGTINALGLQFEGQQHRGGDDALNVARVLWYFAGKYRGFRSHDVEDYYKGEA